MISRITCFNAGLLVTLGLAVTACGSDDAENEGNTTPDTGAQDASTDATDDVVQQDATGQDAGPDVAQEAGLCTEVTSLSGSAVDEADAPFVGASAIVCIYYDNGSSKCLQPKQTDASGVFQVDMPGGSACLESAAYQMKSFDDLTVVGVYCEVDVSAGGAVVAPSPTKLVQAPSCTRDALGDATQPHVVSAPDGAEMTLIPDEIFLFDYAYEEMRLMTWDHDGWGWPCFINPADPPDGLVAFAPEIEVNSENALHISFPNDAGLAAGTAVDLYGLGGAASKTWDGELIHEGDWIVIGEAEVSADGTRIETRAGEGLPFGTWVGWKQK